MIFFLSLLFSLFQSPELIIGQEKVPPGIVFIFEGAVKDKIYPASLHLPENQTHVHLEARVNWDDKQIPKGATPGGFIPFLHITATVTNSKSGQQLFVDLKEKSFKAIEINPRFGGGYPLSYYAGANFPRMLIQEYILEKAVDFLDDWEDNLLILRHDSKVLIYDYKS